MSMPPPNELNDLLAKGEHALGASTNEGFPKADVDLLEAVLLRLAALERAQALAVRGSEGSASLLLVVAVECRNRLLRGRQVLPLSALGAVVTVLLAVGLILFNILRFLGLEQLGIALWIAVGVVALLVAWTVVTETRRTQQWPRIQKALKEVAAAGPWQPNFQRVLELDEIEMRRLQNGPSG